MPFSVLPLLETMLEFYNTTSMESRFEKYLLLLQGNTQDIILPISGFNPMGKSHVNHKIQELIDYKAESISDFKIQLINSKTSSIFNENIFVALNVCDDIGGAWSQIYNTDYNSKFQQASLIKRNFCVPIFYVSQSITVQRIETIIEEYIYRSIYFLKYGQVFTLEDHVKQEIYVEEHVSSSSKILKPQADILEIDKFYKDNHHETDHSIIFNFFYGDSASNSLGYKSHGISEINGYDYVKQIVN